MKKITVILLVMLLLVACGDAKEVKETVEVSSENVVEKSEKQISNEEDSNKETIFSEPIYVETPFEGESLYRMVGVGEGNHIAGFVYGYDDVITYDVEDDFRQVVEEFTIFQHMDSETSRLFYTKKSKEDENVIELYTHLHKEGIKEKMGEFNSELHMLEAIYHQGILVVIFEAPNNKFYVDAFTVIGEYDSDYYEELKEKLEGNTYEWFASDGENLYVVSNVEKKIINLAQGKEEVMLDFSKEPGTTAKVYDASNGRVFVAVTKEQSDGSYKSEYKVLTDGKEIIEVESPRLIEAGGISRFVDKNHVLYMRTGEDTGGLTILNIETGEEKVLDERTADAEIFISENKIFYSIKRDIHYIEFTYE